MNFTLPSRRLVRPAWGLAAASCSRSFHTTPTQPAWFGSGFFGGRNKKSDHTDTTMSKELTGTASSRNRLLDRLTKTRIEGSSIFADELAGSEAAGPPAVAETVAEPSRTMPGPDRQSQTTTGASIAAEHMARATDPDPRSRVRWQRKMVVQRLRSGTDPYSREPRAERLRRTERELLSKSTWLPTSTKKLVHLARQVQGKTVSEALVQMRFSKKKMAAEVKWQLEEARDRAVVERGMGLGEVTGEIFHQGDEVRVKTKDGKFIAIDDPTRMYIAQAWVNRGPWRGFRPDYRSRGRSSRLGKPSASISVILKEEKTRIREHQEREAKKHRQGPWVHLPDRPVTAQRPYYSW